MKMIDDAGLTDDPRDAAAADRILHVRFTVEKRLNHAANTRVAEHNREIDDRAALLEHAHKFEDAAKARSEKLPEDPIYREIEFVTIRVPGDNLTTVHRPVQPSDKVRFRDKYTAFKEARGEDADGTPISELPSLSHSQIEHLNYIGIRTIDQLAKVPDSGGITSLMGGSGLKAKAQEWLTKNRKSSIVSQTNEALAERDAKIATLEAAVQQLLEANATKPAKAASK